jgi:hypothetical protein
MQKLLDFNPNHIPGDYLQAIGLAIACNAQTEHIVEMAIYGMLEVDFEYGAAVTTHMNNRLRDDALRALAEIKMDDPQDLNDLDAILNDVSDACRRRNDYAHASLATDTSNGKVYIVTQKARGSVSVEIKEVDVEAIKKDAERIYSSGLVLMEFLSNHELLPPELPEPRPRGHKLKSERKRRAKQATTRQG